MNSFDDLLNNNPATEQSGGAQLSKEDYAAKKQSERDAVFQLSDQAAEDVSVDSDVFQQYLNVQSTFDRYSAVNALLIMSQNPEATRLGDFDYWKEKGGYVNKGETSIAILEPHSYTKEDGSPGVGYNIKKVFDISQVDTRNVKPPATAPKFTDRQLLQALISKAPMKITGVDNIPGDLGAVTNPETGEISVRRGMEFADTFRSVAQELGYYEADADANKIPVNPSFVGYCTAYMLCRKHGIDTQSFNFAAAPDVFRDLNPQGVKEQLTIIRDAAETIGGRMAKQLDAVTKAAKAQDVR